MTLFLCKIILPFVLANMILMISFQFIRFYINYKLKKIFKNDFKHLWNIDIRVGGDIMRYTVFLLLPENPKSKGVKKLSQSYPISKIDRKKIPFHIRCLIHSGTFSILTCIVFGGIAYTMKMFGHPLPCFGG